MLNGSFHKEHFMLIFGSDDFVSGFVFDL